MWEMIHVNKCQGRRMMMIRRITMIMIVSIVISGSLRKQTQETLSVTDHLLHMAILQITDLICDN